MGYAEQSEVTPNLINKIEKLKTEVQILKEALEFYADPENWMIKTGSAWKVSNPRKHGDESIIRNYNHPNSDWVGTINPGGRKARAALELIKERTK